MVRSSSGARPAQPFAWHDMFENLSLGHLLVVLIIFVLLFGAKRIPEIAGSLGQGINEFKRSLNSTEPASVPPGSRPMPTATVDDAPREPKRLL